MSSRMHKIRVAVWGEAPESPEERRVSMPPMHVLMVDEDQMAKLIAAPTKD